MATPLKLDGLLAKIESTYGTDAAPVVGTDGVRVSERIWSLITIEHAFINRREAVGGGLLGVAPAARTGRIATMEIAIDLRGAGAAYSSSVLPEMDALLRACSLARTDDFTASSENVIYNQADSAHDSVTIWAYAGTKLIKIVGCRGSVRWPIEAGLFGVIRFDMQGIVTAAPTELALPAITYDAAVPPTAVGMALTVAGWSPDVISAEWNQQAEIQQLPSANASDGIVGFEISGVDPIYTISAKLAAIATYDPWAVMKAATLTALSQTLGAVQYNRIKFDVVAAYLEAIANTDQDSFAGIDLTYQLIDFALTFD